MNNIDIENNQISDFTNNQARVIEDIVCRTYQVNYSFSSIVDWKMASSAKSLLRDENIYPQPIGCIIISILRMIFTLFMLSYSKDTSQHIQIFVSVGIVLDLLIFLYNYLIIKQIQKIQRTLLESIYDKDLFAFLNELKDKNLSTKNKSSLIISCVLKNNSFLKQFDNFIKLISWGLFIYSILIISLTGLVYSDKYEIIIPLFLIYTFQNFYALGVMITAQFFKIFNSMRFNIIERYYFLYDLIKKYQVSLFVQRLPSLKYKNLADKQNITNCSICLVDYTQNDTIIQLKCSTQHHFHKVCISSWLDIKSNCPICRTNIMDEFQEANNQSLQNPNNILQSQILSPPQEFIQQQNIQQLQADIYNQQEQVNTQSTASSSAAEEIPNKNMQKQQFKTQQTN